MVAPPATLRTDLDRFSTEDANLVSHYVLDTHGRSLYTDLALAAPIWREYAALADAEVRDIQTLLVRDSRRLRLPAG